MTGDIYEIVIAEGNIEEKLQYISCGKRDDTDMDAEIKDIISTYWNFDIHKIVDRVIEEIPGKYHLNQIFFNKKTPVEPDKKFRYEVMRSDVPNGKTSVP